MTAFGIDVGGTKTSLALISERAILDEVSLPTRGYEETIGDIVAWCRGRLGFSSAAGVGIACSGPLRPSEGIVLNRDTLAGWFGKNIVEDLRQALEKPPVLLNDADAALLGELSAGSLASHASEPAVMLTFGTGVGGAFWDGSRVLVGAEEEHPEIGHILAGIEGPDCYCGAKGCLESLASGTALNEAARGIGLPGLTELAQAARSGKKDAVSVVDNAGTAIFNALWTLTHAFRPACFVLGGGVMDVCFDLLAPSEVWVTASTVPGNPPWVLKAQLGNRAGLYGAAFAAMRGGLDR